MEDEAGTRDRAAAAAVARRRLRWVAPIAFLVTVVVIFALVVAVRATETSSQPATIQSAGFTRPASTTPARFALPVLQQASGQPTPRSTVTMGTLTGRPVVLNMWSSSCTVCKAETPAVESVAKRAGRTVTFVGVDTIDQKPAALAFLRRYHVTYLQLFDPNETVGSGYAIPGLPVTVFVSAKGKVVGEYLGALNARTLTHYLASLFGVRVPAT